LAQDEEPGKSGGEAGSGGGLGALTAPAGTSSGLTQNFDVALASLRQLDDLFGDHFISEVARAVNSRTSRFEGDAHETSDLRIEVLAA
jgi:hypothetical protein